MSRRRRKGNPSSLGELAGGVAGIVVPIAGAMLARFAQGAGSVPPVAGALTLTGATVGSGFAVLNGIGRASFSRGYAVASIGSFLAGVAMAALAPKPEPKAAVTSL